MIGCGMVSPTILGSAFGPGSSCLHLMRVYSCHLSINPPVKMKYCLLLSIPKKSPNIGFVLSTGLVNNPLISTQLWNYMLDRYVIRNRHVVVLITPIKHSSYFHNSSAAGTDTKYESNQTILSVLVNGITSSFRNFVP